MENYEINNVTTEETEGTNEMDNSRGGFGAGVAIAAVITGLVIIGKVVYDKIGPKKNKPEEETEEPIDVASEENDIETEEA
jgi:hypothetical protein